MFTAVVNLPREIDRAGIALTDECSPARHLLVVFAELALRAPKCVGAAQPLHETGVWLPCTPLSASDNFAARYLSGHAEADIAHGILSQLELESYAIGPLPPNAPVPNAHARAANEKACKAHRQELLREVAGEEDPAMRKRLVQNLPPC